MDDKQRIVLVETQTIADSVAIGAPVSVQRYQLGNHLGSASVELDDSGGLICYEEFHPYGTTAFQAGRSAAEVSFKRYRYTGMELDDETGFGYYGARHYVSWLGRWLSFDPKGIVAGVNSYAFVVNNPIRLIDPDGQDWQDSLSWTQRAALWVDDKVQENAVARGVVRNLAKRGEAMVQAPGALADKYKADGLVGVGAAMVEGVAHLATDTAQAAVDVGFNVAKAIDTGDAGAIEQAASRSVDVVLNIADLVTIGAGANAAKNATVGGARALADGAQSVAATLAESGPGVRGLALATPDGVVIAERTVAATAQSAVAADAIAADLAKSTGILMMESRHATGGRGSQRQNGKTSF
jgi:RHS repeat-associated protein